MSDRPLNYPRLIRAMTAAAVLTLGALYCWLGFRSFPNPDMDSWIRMGLGVPCLLLAIALWRRMRWAQLPATLLICALLLHSGWVLFTTRNLWAGWAIPALLLMLWDIRNHFTPERMAAELEGSEDESRPLISLVLLLRRPRHLDATLVARYCEAAWGGRFEVIRESSETGRSSQPQPAKDEAEQSAQFVAGSPPLLVVGAADRLHLVHCNDQPYFDEPQEIADRAGDLRIRRVLEENRGWIAVDLVRRKGEEIDPADHYPRLARLIAELAGPDCQAIYQPAGGHFNHWDECLETKLRQGDLAGVFAELTSPAVVEVPDDDPRMIEASRQARARWSEFVDAFQSGDASHCAVKAPIQHGERREFIWVTVDAIDEREVRGRLGNDPVDLGDLHLDSPVSVPVSSIEDWVFIRDDQPTGLFSVKALSEIQGERRQRA